MKTIEITSPDEDIIINIPVRFINTPDFKEYPANTIDLASIVWNWASYSQTREYDNIYEGNLPNLFLLS